MHALRPATWVLQEPVQQSSSVLQLCQAPLQLPTTGGTCSERGQGMASQSFQTTASAVRCGVVRCRAVGCCAVLCATFKVGRGQGVAGLHAWAERQLGQLKAGTERQPHGQAAALTWSSSCSMLRRARAWHA